MITSKQPGPQGAPARPSLWMGFKAQIRCVEALMVRDLMARYGRGNIGFLWVLLEPMILCVGVMTMWSLLKGEKDHGVNLVMLVISGYMPLTLWRHITGRGIFALRSNASVFVHRRMSAIDCIISMVALEFAGSTAALVVITATTITLGLIEPIRDYYSLSLGWVMMASLTIGIMLVICALTKSSEIWERFIAPFQYLMMPISGAFFMMDWMPSAAQEIAWYNPTIHCYEMFRRGFLADGIRTHSEPLYVLVWAIGLLTFGLWLLERARHKATFR